MPITSRSARLLPVALIVLVTLVSCVSATPTAPAPASPTALAPAVPTQAKATGTPPPTLAPLPAPTLSTNSLATTVQAGLPAGAFEGVKVLPLKVPAGQRPLWAVHSYGMRNFDLDPTPDHFLAIYTQDKGNWQELTRQTFSPDDVKVAAPDYLDAASLTQVEIEPGHIWLQLEGGAGAHGGVYDLLSFAGNQLKVELNAWAQTFRVSQTLKVYCLVRRADKLQDGYHDQVGKERESWRS